MSEYYVIRNKTTGLYFRGKGVNRWGKHYNQASIYRMRGMAEHTIKEVAWKGEQAEIVPIQVIENAADIVKVVRCKDCERRSKSADLTNTVYCKWLKIQMDKNDFCSYGESRLNDDKTIT